MEPRKCPKCNKDLPTLPRDLALCPHCGTDYGMTILALKHEAFDLIDRGILTMITAPYQLNIRTKLRLD